VFDSDSSKTFFIQKHLGTLVIAPVYVQRQLDVDKEDYEVGKATFFICLETA
jgi:hypothetical protein